MNKKERALKVYGILNTKYPNVGTFLAYKNPYELLIAVILSAQCTDKRVNLVTPGLFSSFPTPERLSKGPLSLIKEKIKSINFFNNKSKNIQETAELLVLRHHSKVPQTLNELIKLPGVGRKTANVVLGQAFNTPGITVDTHVNRVSNRLGFTKQTDAVKAEKELMSLWPTDYWIKFSSILILHGRETCQARKPLCDTCEFLAYCPFNK
ncbi:endonuclease III [Candidatus Marinamargulisbacteria bacterium SCGC AAA071-K20]|nr:endonuclease III [Candidatus Marinamargulisbacteria bacterium SCGC AAA071-K20]